MLISNTDPVSHETGVTFSADHVVGASPGTWAHGLFRLTLMANGESKVREMRLPEGVKSSLCEENGRGKYVAVTQPANSPAPPTPIKKGASLLLPLDIAVKRPQLLKEEWAPKNGRGPVDNLLSVWDTHHKGKDWTQVKVVLPESFAQNLPPNFIKWQVEGVSTPIADNTLETPKLRWPGQTGRKKITIDFPMARLRKFLYVDLPNVGSESTQAVYDAWWNENPIKALHLKQIIARHATEATIYADQVMKLGGSRPSHRNAFKHAHWMALCSSDARVGQDRAWRWGVAYEFDDKNNESNPASEATMDLWNDWVGVTTRHTVGADNPLEEGEADGKAIKASLQTKLTAGELMIWDGPAEEHATTANPNLLELLLKSNDQKYYETEEHY